MILILAALRETFSCQKGLFQPPTPSCDNNIMWFLRPQFLNRYGTLRYLKGTIEVTFCAQKVLSMLPEPMPALKGKAAEEFLKYDRRTLSESEKKDLKRADKIFDQIREAP